jgi:hypothetical protein
MLGRVGQVLLQNVVRSTGNFVIGVLKSTASLGNVDIATKYVLVLSLSCIELPVLTRVPLSLSISSTIDFNGQGAFDLQGTIGSFTIGRLAPKRHNINVSGVDIACVCSHSCEVLTHSCTFALQFNFNGARIGNLSINTCPGTRGVASFENFLRSVLLHSLACH